MTAASSGLHRFIDPGHRAPVTSDPEALIPEARARQRARQIRIAAAVLLVVGLGGALYGAFGSAASAAPTAQQIEQNVAAAAPQTTRLIAVETVNDTPTPAGLPTVLMATGHPEIGGGQSISYVPIPATATLWFDPTTERMNEIVVGTNGKILSAGAAWIAATRSEQAVRINTRSVAYSSHTWRASGLTASPRFLNELGQSFADPLAYPEAVGRNPELVPGLTSNIGAAAVVTEGMFLFGYATHQSASSYVLIGEQTIDGQPTFHLRQTIAAYGIQRKIGTTRFDVWISRSTYRPVREQWSSQTGLLRTINIRWLPRTPANLSLLTMRIPKGFTQVSTSHRLVTSKAR